MKIQRFKGTPVIKVIRAGAEPRFFLFIRNDCTPVELSKIDAQQLLAVMGHTLY